MLKSRGGVEKKLDVESKRLPDSSCKRLVGSGSATTLDSTEEAKPEEVRRLGFPAGRDGVV